MKKRENKRKCNSILLRGVVFKERRLADFIG